MKKLLFLLLFVGIIAGTINAAMVLVNQDVIGEWKFEALTAPEGYQKGVIVITENNNVLEGVVKLDSGTDIRFSNVSIEGETLKLGLYVEYEYVTVTAKVEKGKMEGTVDSSQGKIALTAERKQ